MEEKRKAKLHHWYLEKIIQADGTEGCIARGNVTGHYRLDDTNFIHTSLLESLEVNRETEEVTIITRNTKYLCRLSECDFSRGDTVCFIPFLSEYGDKYNKEKEYEVDECSILLVFSDHENYYFETAIAKENGVLFKGTMSPHIGMLQDSCLVNFSEFSQKFNYERIIDIRYFPHCKHLETYSMETAGLKVYIENAGENEIFITAPVGVIEVVPGERKRICKENTVLKNVWELDQGDLYPAAVII